METLAICVIAFLSGAVGCIIFLIVVLIEPQRKMKRLNAKLNRTNTLKIGK